MVPGPIPFMDGFGSSGHHAQMLRNQRVGSTWITASSGPRLHTLISTNKSAGVAFAYSTNTSKYRFSLNMPVSISSYRDRCGSDFCWCLSNRDRDMHSEDTYKDTSCMSASECGPSNNNIP